MRVALRDEEGAVRARDFSWDGHLNDGSRDRQQYIIAKAIGIIPVL